MLKVISPETCLTKFLKNPAWRMWKLSTSYKNNKIAGDEAEFKAIPSLLRKLLAKQSTMGLGGLRMGPVPILIFKTNKTNYNLLLNQILNIVISIHSVRPYP